MPQLEKTDRTKPVNNPHHPSPLSSLSSALVPGFTATAPYWPEPVDILLIDKSLPEIVAVQAVGLTSKSVGTQYLLKELTAETFLERYGANAWPESEKWVTTAQLWDRFTSQVSLPILANEQVFLEILRQGQYEGLLAIGLLVDAQSPRDQRDSYLHLHFKKCYRPTCRLRVSAGSLYVRPFTAKLQSSRYKLPMPIYCRR